MNPVGTVSVSALFIGIEDARTMRAIATNENLFAFTFAQRVERNRVFAYVRRRVRRK